MTAAPKDRYYRQRVPAIGLSLERGTADVPNDGYFHVRLEGEIKGRFRSKRDALGLYMKLLRDSGYKPGPTPENPTRNEAVERYLDDLESYWLESHKHMRRGGKGRY